MPSEEGGGLGVLDWETLIGRIEDGKCTPFLGAGANYGLLPLGTDIAEAWVREYGYPGGKSAGLEEISQFLAVQSSDAMVPKEKISRMLRARLEQIGDARLDEILVSPENPISLLAELPLPVYITTNYDNLMVRALRRRGKQPREEICRWNSFVKSRPSVFDQPGGYQPTVAAPLVFYLHGSLDVVESLVLTEDDYLDFLVSISRQRILPPRVEEAMTGASLLFLGYRLADMNFRVIFRGLVGALEGSLRRINVSVQLPPSADTPNADAARNYMAKYFDARRVRVFWGTAQNFAAEVRGHWRGGKALA